MRMETLLCGLHILVLEIEYVFYITTEYDILLNLHSKHENKTTQYLKAMQR